MGGQTSRMVREIVQDSMYIIRQTNRATYQHTRASHDDIQSKLMALRRMKQEMLQSEAQRSDVFASFHERVGKQQQTLDEQVDGFVKQFELPKSYQSMADVSREEQAQEKLKDMEKKTSK
ncbi:hypothetical protein PsorP6_011299 [Peronosclerospora sorghi]|uniref:Uncharacterized protein n=1 Tax=Peronosclerospora sorghi TaxID=230839 RepID=A0ACC0WJF5_9STRA|nr:hypothetical protein PsorP6_011299 [Peronosclerospora sorghi]